jgi:TonB family protein
MVLTAVAPVYTPIAVLANVGGEVFVDVTVASDGKVRSTNALNGNKLLIHTSLEAAKRWRFEPGASDRKAVLKFSFRIMPKGTPEEDLGAMFMPPFSIEVRKTIPEQTMNYDPAAKGKKSTDKR